MFFNTRQPPLRSKIRNPLSFFFPRPDPITQPNSPEPRSRSPSPSPVQTDPPSRPRSQSASRPIHSIPPARNCRGEIIFSRRVAKEFQEGYDRYRATFEKKRDEAIRQIREQKSLERWWWLYKLRFWAPLPSTAANPPTHSTITRITSNRGRPSSGGASSRSGTPPIMDRSGSPMRQSRSSARKSSNKRTPSNSSSGSTRREVADEGGMRMLALSRSFAQGSLAPS
jgi:hypothetical protein